MNWKVKRFLHRALGIFFTVLPIVFVFAVGILQRGSGTVR